MKPTTNTKTKSAVFGWEAIQSIIELTVDEIILTNLSILILMDKVGGIH
jgi:hypothetical protein